MVVAAGVGVVVVEVEFVVEVEAEEAVPAVVADVVAEAVVLTKRKG